MVRKKFIQPGEHPSRSSRLLGSTSSGTKWIFPDNIPSEYDWVSDEVLGTPSKVSLSYLEKLKEAKVVIRTFEEGKYELVVPNNEERICYSNRSLETKSDYFGYLIPFFTKVGRKIPFFGFQIEILQECKCAPSQLHPNSLSIIRSFELVCDFLEHSLDVEFFLFEDSYHDFKEMYFKKRFHIYWNYNASSSRPSLDDLSSEERVVVSILIKLWEVEPLDPKNIFSNEEAALEIAGGLEAVATMCRRLLAGNSAIEEGSMLATHSDKDNAQGTSEVIKTGSSPPSSPPRKKKNKGKGSFREEFVSTNNEALESFGCALKEGFRASDFISNFLTTEETEEKASEFAVEDELTRIQKMLHRSVVLSYDVGREIPKFRSTIAAKDKAVHESAVKIKNLNANLATLQQENEKLKRDAKSANAEKAAVDGVAQTEKNIKDQCALIAPNIDFSGVSAYKKVVNDEVIEF
ncbi:hypothetical protein PIB30_004509 [Stylosanthes scabra]|uniref:Uncharacterized protein n=1 Tax=Stylosanthes scabra TaxID=79078 RepID=A0ABU6X2V7_9FABA|nr:hypothetical protein [Stylosanthes scabra]